MCNFVEATPFCLEVHRAVKPRALRAFFRLFTFLSSLAPLSVTLKKNLSTLCTRKSYKLIDLQDGSICLPIVLSTEEQDINFILNERPPIDPSGRQK